MSFTTIPTAGERFEAAVLSALITEVRPLYVAKGGDTARTNNTMSDDPDLSLAVVANTIYELGGILRYTCASATPDFQIALTVPAGTTAYLAPVGPSQALASAVGTASWYSPPSATAVFFGSNDNVTLPVFVKLGGRIAVSSTAGNVRIQWAQVTTDANAVTLLAGSYMTLQQLV